MYKQFRFAIGSLILGCVGVVGSQSLAAQEKAESAAPTHANVLRGAYGPYRANNDLLYYHLDIRVNPDEKFISGKNTIRFKMLQDGQRIQLDLTDALNVDKILLGSTPLKYERDSGAVFIDFPETLRAGKIYSIDFYYSGHPVESGRFGSMTFKTDSSPGIRGSIRRAKNLARAPGGRTRTNGATKCRTWRSASQYRMAWWTLRTENSWAPGISVTVTRSGTGSSTTRSTITTCL